jgi:hypothetical protein
MDRSVAAADVRAVGISSEEARIDEGVEHSSAHHMVDAAQSAHLVHSQAQSRHLDEFGLYAFNGSPHGPSSAPSCGPPLSSEAFSAEYRGSR